jgi:asparagine synthase (glutamine-hydrolysing)
MPRLRRLKRSVHTLRIKDPAHRYAAWLQLFMPDMQRELLRVDLSEELDGYDPAWPYPKYYAAYRAPSTEHRVGGSARYSLNRLMYIDLKTWLVDMYLEKTDKATMASSLEARLPLLDHRLVELAFQIPAQYKVRGWSTKRILKRAVRGLVPPQVLKKPKHGFSVPVDPWFRGSLKDFTSEVLLDGQTRSRGYFNMALVERLWKEHIEGRHDRTGHLWLLLNFELWQRAYLDGSPESKVLSAESHKEHSAFSTQHSALSTQE